MPFLDITSINFLYGLLSVFIQEIVKGLRRNLKQFGGIENGQKFY